MSIPKDSTAGKGTTNTVGTDVDDELTLLQTSGIEPCRRVAPCAACDRAHPHSGSFGRRPLLEGESLRSPIRCADEAKTARAVLDDAGELVSRLGKIRNARRLK